MSKIVSQNSRDTRDAHQSIQRNIPKISGVAPIVTSFRKQKKEKRIRKNKSSNLNDTSIETVSVDTSIETKTTPQTLEVPQIKTWSEYLYSMIFKS